MPVKKLGENICTMDSVLIAGVSKSFDLNKMKIMNKIFAHYVSLDSTILQTY
jgi:hypothetical protein